MPADSNPTLMEIANPTPRQKEAWEMAKVKRFILYGGARGGGKSRFLRWWCLTYLVRLHELGIDHAHVGLFCSTYPELRDRQISKINEEFPTGVGELKESKVAGLGFHLNEAHGGGVIALRNLDDPEKYRSSEFAGIAVDELTLTTLETFNYLRGSLRWVGVERPVFIAGTNPGGRGHGWVKSLWVDRQYPPEMADISEEFVFIRSLPSDNPHLSPTYWNDLKSLPPALARAWVEGDWSVFEGQALAWSDAKHAIDPYEIPGTWTRWRAVDWGFSNPWCVLWLARDPDTGRVIIYREAYATGLTDRQQAHTILDMSPPDERITVTYADPSMWASKSSGMVVTTTADEYASAGVPLTRADNDRLGGKRKVDRLLQPMPDGRPGLLVFRNCTNLIRTLPSLAYDKTKTEDVDTSQEDHAYDALRYGLTQARDYTVQPGLSRPFINPFNTAGRHQRRVP